MFLAAFTNSEGKVFNLILSQSLAPNERALWFLSSFSRSRAPRNSSRVIFSIHEHVMNINQISRYLEQGYWLQLYAINTKTMFLLSTKVAIGLANLW